LGGFFACSSIRNISHETFAMPNTLHDFVKVTFQQLARRLSRTSAAPPQTGGVLANCFNELPSKGPLTRGRLAEVLMLAEHFPKLLSDLGILEFNCRRSCAGAVAIVCGNCSPISQSSSGGASRSARSATARCPGALCLGGDNGRRGARRCWVSRSAGCA
jgi:hypothetical protein